MEGNQPMTIQPYLFFEGKTEEAIEFYKKAIGASVDMMMRVKDMPPSENTMLPPGNEEKILHASFKVGDDLIMASDGMCSGKPKFDGFSISYTVQTDAEAEKAFAALLEGGKVTQPLIKTFFASKFGMLVDKFGVHWMVATAS
jgi:PhnB protein